MWYDAVSDAEDMINTDIETDIQGFDIDGEVIKVARENAVRAGVERLIHFQTRPVSELSHHGSYGFIITNPPYGERLEEAATLPQIYTDFGRSFAKLDTWSAYLITSYEDTEKYVGKKADKKRKKLEKLIIPSTVIIIPKHSFIYCSNLKEVKIEIYKKGGRNKYDS